MATLHEPSCLIVLVPSGAGQPTMTLHARRAQVHSARVVEHRQDDWGAGPPQTVGVVVEAPRLEAELGASPFPLTTAQRLALAVLQGDRQAAGPLADLVLSEWLEGAGR